MTAIEKSPNLPQSSQDGKAFPDLRGHWLRGNLHQMQDDPLGLYTQARAEYGDYVRIRIVPHIYCYLLTHPDAIEHVLHKGHKNYRKPDIFYKSVGLLVGNGLFTNEGEPWLRQRKLAQPAFHNNYISTLCAGMVESALAFASEMESGTGRPIDLLDEMMNLGLRIAGETLFSADISGTTDTIGKAFRAMFKHVSNRLNSLQLIPNWLPTKSNRSFAASKKILDNIVMEMIAARRKSSVKPRDLLTMLIGAHDEAGEGMMDRQLMDEVLTLLTAGHETIGAALAWSWYLLALHPKIQDDVYDEVRGRLGGRSPGFDDLEHLPLVTAVFEESMRLYPPGWGELRESIEPDQICGYDLPAKAMIILCQWVTHRHPDFWDEPEKFQPQRFLPGGAANRHRFAYFPFGGGPRICIGMQFAMAEGPLVIATILQRFRIELVADQQIVPDATFTLRPKFGLKVILHSRGK